MTREPNGKLCVLSHFTETGYGEITATNRPEHRKSPARRSPGERHRARAVEARRSRPIAILPNGRLATDDSDRYCKREVSRSLATNTGVRRRAGPSLDSRRLP